MLKITQNHADEIKRHAKEMHPIEACGVIAGEIGSDHKTSLHKIENIANSETFFQFDPAQQLKVWRELDNRGEEIQVVYHSHTDSDAYPSKEDVEYALDPRMHYVIVPSNKKYGEKLRSYRIINGTIIEETVSIV